MFERQHKTCAAVGEFCEAAGGVIGGIKGGLNDRFWRVVIGIQAAAGVMSSGESRLLEYGVSDELAFSVGLACGGRIRVYVEALE